MRDEFARPYALRRFDELSRNAVALVDLNPNPEEWRAWDVFARDAERAASARDEEQTLHACTGCHHTYRREYVERYRERPLRRAAAGSH